jgi:DNA mismatch repair protein MutL
MTSIHLLSDETIGLIAAGEVIETPACAVKELIENSLDAGATRIDVEIYGCGLKRLVVRDNGRGMHSDDVKLAAVRHATSKLRSADDLLRTTSHGFRGEALAAIASISELRIETCAKGEPVGVRADWRGGKLIHLEAIGAPVGTSIEITDLFANSPVRRSFQPKDKQIKSALLKIVEMLALGNPGVSFNLEWEGKSALRLPAHVNEDRLEALRRRLIECGERPDDLVEISVDAEGAHLEGFVGTPKRAENGRRVNWTFVNRRAVISSQIDSAVRGGYATVISERASPFYCLNCDLPLERVDINIHPKKKEVDFHLPTALGAALIRQMASKFAPKIPALSLSSYTTATPLEISIGGNQTLDTRRGEGSSEYSHQTTQLQIDNVELLYMRGPYALFTALGELWLCHGSRLARAHLLCQVADASIAPTPLLVPFSIPTQNPQAAGDPDMQNMLESMGFSIRPSGPRSVLVEAMPPHISYALARQFLEIALEEIGRPQRENTERDTLRQKIFRRARRAQTPNCSREELCILVEGIFAADAHKNPLFSEALHAIDNSDFERIL